MRKMVLLNQKGGCGKTTTAINLASCLAQAGRTVLLLDLDPQGHAGLGLGHDPDGQAATIHEVLTGKIEVAEAIQPVRPHLEAIFSNMLLSGFEQLMAGVPGREKKLLRCLDGLEGRYEYLIIDSPPNVGLLTINGLLAAEEVIVPVDASPFSLHGLGKLLESIRIIEEQTGHPLSHRILAANIDLRTNFGQALVETLRSRFPEHGFTTVIKTCTRLREAAAHGRPVLEFDRRCAAALDFSALTAEILAEEAAVLESRPLRKEVFFCLEAPPEASVQLAGDFTGWKPVPLQLVNGDRAPRWQKAVRLRPGIHHYKFLVDGEWRPDPAHDRVVANGLGTDNSWLQV